MSIPRQTEIMENTFSLDRDAITNIDYLNEKIHRGEMLFVSKVLTVANNGVVYIHHIAGSTKYLHSKIEAKSVGAWRFTSYIGTTYSDPGDELTQVNRKNDSSYVPQVVFYENEVGDINVLGTERLDFIFGSGTNPAKASSGTGTEKLESAFAPDVDILVKLVNNSGSEQLLSIIYDYYEKE
ncbi:MAG: hypothetical protein ACTSPI_04730 [Candidatus Heimdallarchaeaceae archaeon]